MYVSEIGSPGRGADQPIDRINGGRQGNDPPSSRAVSYFKAVSSTSTLTRSSSPASILPHHFRNLPSIGQGRRLLAICGSEHRLLLPPPASWPCRGPAILALFAWRCESRLAFTFLYPAMIYTTNQRRLTRTVEGSTNYCRNFVAKFKCKILK